ncbi:GntR family transcriptional regulator [[Haemophilus] ducreyi]|uniref:MocR-like pyridoxine biosynthesis transcription factor PdxR n=1 Tax=Haemophilus ducreyi TaxID=730 RepID=UPI0007CDB283|nr:PLP-dependent aminotransferase family protein [[Haemophilus] ducreyi]ANF70467.1 GntR family transcriptional regulator [[Haemophilus] ducreyi]ANF72349.1 GntR family transcriptional regulator [[Haemophilus] ducreyi]
MKKLSYLLNKDKKQPLYLQLYQQIKRSIYQQELQLNDKLPSKRRLSEHLQISQNTVERAYAQLLAEGYIESKARSGFLVCFQSEHTYPTTCYSKKITKITASTNYLLDFNPNKIDIDHFPLKQWKKCANLDHNTWLNSGDPQGDLNLRQQISQYLLASRGVHCEAEQIIIGAGVESCLQRLILLFQQLQPQMNWTMESYGYTTVEKLLNLYHKPIIKMPFSTENYPLDIGFLTQNKIDIAYLTPSHLYPFGHILTINQRQSLLEWAIAKTGRYIIEDDYDSEFRYQGKPIPSLQSLDNHGKVIYLGSFSKLLMPSLRITFLVLPKTLLNAYQQYCGFLNMTVSRLEQQRLAKFIQTGEFEKHINRMRKVYRRKMELLCQLLMPYSYCIRYYGEHSGFYLLIELYNETRSLAKLVQLAETHRIKVYPIEYQNKKLFSLGFGHLTEAQLRKGITQLFDCWQIKPHAV